MKTPSPGKLEDVTKKVEEALTETYKRIPWTKVKSSKELSGWRETKAYHYILPDGQEKVFDIAMHGDSTCILALTEDLKFILTKQYRPGPETFIIELPGGIVDSGEDPITGAARELLEETGYAGDLQPIGEFWLDAYSTGKKYSFLATNCKLVQGQKTDEDEFIEVILMSIEEFASWLQTADSTTALTAYRALFSFIDGGVALK